MISTLDRLVLDDVFGTTALARNWQAKRCQVQLFHDHQDYEHACMNAGFYLQDQGDAVSRRLKIEEA